jgi:hypothetical protein
MEFVQICKIDAFPPYNSGNGVMVFKIDINFRNHIGPLIAKLLITLLYYFRVTRMDQNTIIIQDLPNYNSHLEENITFHHI